MTTPGSVTNATTTATTTAAELVVEVFHAEVDGCDPCARAVSEVHAAASLVHDELAARALDLVVRTVPLVEPGHAQALGIDNPVTVRVSGTDISPDDSGGHLAACGIPDVAPKSCRTYGWRGETFDAPPAGLIVEAIHRHLDTGRAAAGPSSSSQTRFQ